MGLLIGTAGFKIGPLKGGVADVAWELLHSFDNSNLPISLSISLIISKKSSLPLFVCKGIKSITGSQSAPFKGLVTSALMVSPYVSLTFSGNARVGGRGGGFYLNAGVLLLLMGGDFACSFFLPSK